MHMLCIFIAYFLHVSAHLLHISAYCLHILCIFLHIRCIFVHISCIFVAYDCVFELVFAYSLHMPAWRPTGGFFACAAPLPRLARQWLCLQHLQLGPSPQPQPSHPNNHPISPALRSCPPLAQRRRQPQLQQPPHTAQPARLSTPKPAAPWPPLSRARPASVQSFSPTHPAACRLSRALHELASRCERKVPEIMVHKLQEALAKQLDMFGSNAVLLESGTDSVSKFCLKTTKYAKNKLNVQNMQKQTKYADIHADFARKKLIDCSSTSDSKLRMNRAENGPNFAHHVLKPPAIDGLILTHKVSAAAAVILFHRGR